MVVAFSVANVIGYAVTGRFTAIVMFVLVSLVVHHFQKNMATVLVSALFITSLFAVNGRMYEGLENAGSAVRTLDAKDKDIADILPIVKQASTNKDVKEIAASSNVSRPAPSSKVVDLNNEDLNASSGANDASPVGAGSGAKKAKAKKTNESFGPRLDYAATIQQSYQNLDEMLGGQAIQDLTKDTQALMKQQQTLFDTMQNMVPVLQGAQSLLKNFKMDGLTESLKGLKGIGTSPSIAAT